MLVGARKRLQRQIDAVEKQQIEGGIAELHRAHRFALQRAENLIDAGRTRAVEVGDQAEQLAVHDAIAAGQHRNGVGHAANHLDPVGPVSRVGPAQNAAAAIGRLVQQQPNAVVFAFDPGREFFQLLAAGRRKGGADRRQRPHLNLAQSVGPLFRQQRSQLDRIDEAEAHDRPAPARP